MTYMLVPYAFHTAVLTVHTTSKPRGNGGVYAPGGNRRRAGTVGLLKNPNREADKSEKPGLTREFTQ